jgi:hypothetical protein
MIGAAVAQLTAEASAFAFNLTLSQRYYPMDYQWRRLSHVLLVALVVYSLSALIHVDHPQVSFAIRLLIWMLYPVLLAVTGFVTAEEKQRLRALWKQVVLPRLVSIGLRSQAK